MQNRGKKCKIKLFCVNLNCGEGLFFSSLFINMLLTSTESKYCDVKAFKKLDLWLFNANRNKFLSTIYKNPLIYEHKKHVFFSLFISVDVGKINRP